MSRLYVKYIKLETIIPGADTATGNLVSAVVIRNDTEHVYYPVTEASIQRTHRALCNLFYGTCELREAYFTKGREAIHAKSSYSKESAEGR